MKKQLLVLGLVLGLCMGTSSVVYAAQIPVVCLTEQERFEYYMDGDESAQVKQLSLTQFVGMRAGDLRTQTIRLHNGSAHSANFYITEATIQALQIQNLTSNGKYQFRLQVGKSLPTAQSLLDFSSEKKAKSSQYSHFREKLSRFVYVAALDAGCDTNLFLTFKIENRGGQTVSEEDYTKMLETIPIAFRAYDHEADTVYTETSQDFSNEDSTEVVVDEAAMPSDDSYKYGIYSAILLGGVALTGGATLVKNRNKKGE